MVGAGQHCRAGAIGTTPTTPYITIITHTPAQSATASLGLSPSQLLHAYTGQTGSARELPLGVALKE